MIVTIIIITMKIIMIVIINRSMLDLLGIEFHHLFIYVISNLITQITCLKSLIGLTSFFFALFFFYFIVQY
jgi:hypothetical protein